MLGKSSMDLVLVPSAMAAMVGYHLLHLQPDLPAPAHHRDRLREQRQARLGPAHGADDGAGGGRAGAERHLRRHLGRRRCASRWPRSSARGVSSRAPAAVTSGGSCGGTSDATAKFAWLLACFLASFTYFVQSAGCYVHASFLISALGAPTRRRATCNARCSGAAASGPRGSGRSTSPRRCSCESSSGRRPCTPAPGSPSPCFTCWTTPCHRTATSSLREARGYP